MSMTVALIGLLFAAPRWRESSRSLPSKVRDRVLAGERSNQRIGPVASMPTRTGTCKLRIEGLGLPLSWSSRRSISS